MNVLMVKVKKSGTFDQNGKIHLVQNGLDQNRTTGKLGQSQDQSQDQNNPQVLNLPMVKGSYCREVKIGVSAERDYNPGRRKIYRGQTVYM